MGNKRKRKILKKQNIIYIIHKKLLSKRQKTVSWGNSERIR